MKLVILVVFAVYAVGFWKFWTGYNRTNFERSLPQRLLLSFLWPALFAINPSYRKNFQKALRGR